MPEEGSTYIEMRLDAEGNPAEWLDPQFSSPMELANATQFLLRIVRRGSDGSRSHPRLFLVTAPDGYDTGSGKNKGSITEEEHEGRWFLRCAFVKKR